MIHFFAHDELQVMFTKALGCKVKFIPEKLIDHKQSIMKYMVYILDTINAPISDIPSKMKELFELFQICGIEAITNEPYYNDIRCIINRNDLNNIQNLLILHGKLHT